MKGDSSVSYVPAPKDTSGILLNDEIMNLSEELAKTHTKYGRNQG